MCNRDGKAPLKVDVKEGKTSLSFTYSICVSWIKIKLKLPECFFLCLIILLAASTLPVVLRKKRLGKN
ncbi:hypothetical protein DRO69_14435 [Candidatus Bathyarchaeota archaeon]|nr:MAG: hypothetical protein DRO69_14435 [Candidatus Bathyarchaeota archaeon]